MPPKIWTIELETLPNFYQHTTPVTDTESYQIPQIEELNLSSIWVKVCLLAIPILICLFCCRAIIWKTIIHTTKLFSCIHHCFPSRHPTAHASSVADISSQVIMHVGNEGKQLGFVILTLPYLISQYDISFTNTKPRINITGKINKKLNIQWKNTVFHHQYLDLHIAFPNTVNISHAQAHQLQQIINHSFHVNMHIKNPDQSISQLQIHPSFWNLTPTVTQQHDMYPLSINLNFKAL